MTTNEEQLLTQINAAVAAANEAEKATTEACERLSTAQHELESRNMTVGKLLLEAKKLHPVKREFDAFLERVVGLKRARVSDLIRLAGGDITEEELKKNTRERVRRHRANKKRPKPELVSVTPTLVTESDESTETRALAELITESDALTEFTTEGTRSTERSAHALEEFTWSCNHWLPRMTVEDQQKAFVVVRELLTESKAEAA